MTADGFSTDGGPVQEMIGARLVPVKVTRQEELQLGATYAPMIRRLGNAATEAEQAVYQAEAVADESRGADELARHQTVQPGMDELGRTPHTAWMDSVLERLSDARRQLNDLFTEISVECIQRERSTGSGVGE